MKWLVLSDELFDEVCSEFTIKKLELSHEEKRALFDADWVPQVTYELSKCIQGEAPEFALPIIANSLSSISHKACPTEKETCYSAIYEAI